MAPNGSLMQTDPIFAWLILVILCVVVVILAQVAFDMFCTTRRWRREDAKRDADHRGALMAWARSTRRATLPPGKPGTIRAEEQALIDKLTRGTIRLLVGLTIAAIGVAVLVGFA